MGWTSESSSSILQSNILYKSRSVHLIGFSGVKKCPTKSSTCVIHQKRSLYSNLPEKLFIVKKVNLDWIFKPQRLPDENFLDEIDWRLFVKS
jgi:hypothetical protein